MKLRGRQIDQWGNVVFDQDGLINHLMKGNQLASDLLADTSPGVQKYNQMCRELDHPDDQVHPYAEPSFDVEEWDQAHQSQWFIPQEYQDLDVQEWLLEKCTTEQQIVRVLEEWQLFDERQLTPVLKLLIYLVDDFRRRNVVWGVGRGSSVASYCLFLIGIHRIDSILYDLDPREFLK